MDEMSKVVTADKIIAKHICLVDNTGRERASMFVSDSSNDSATVIRILGETGVPQIELQVAGTTASIRIANTNDQPGISLAVNDGCNGLMIGDAEGAPVVQMGVYLSKDDEGNTRQPFILLRDFETGYQWYATPQAPPEQTRQDCNSSK